MKEKRLVSGIGINNYRNCEKNIHVAWNNMFRRCYDLKCQIKQPTYIGCLVDPVWHKLSDFRTWFLASNYRSGLHLDKDIINRGNKVYGPDNCSFVSRRINNLLIDSGAKRGLHRIGVSFNKGHQMFESYCNINGKQKFIGYFETEEEAFQAYKKFKEAQIKVVAEEEYQLGNCTKEVRDALMDWKI